MHWPVLRFAVFAAWISATPLVLQAQTSADPSLRSGNVFLSKDLLAMQNDTTRNPVQLWLEQGRNLWGNAPKVGTASTCFDCHGDVQSMKGVATQFPKWSRSKQQLINLEDQILICAQRSSQALKGLENPDVLALSALLHEGSKGLTFRLNADAGDELPWQNALNKGAEQFTTRVGRMNLACTHCHDLNVGKQMRADVISPGHPTGFPIFKMSWQSMGSIDRRLRACYSGVQAEVPAPGSQALRQLELFLKVRAQGLPIDGPSLRR